MIWMWMTISMAKQALVVRSTARAPLGEHAVDLSAGCGLMGEVAALLDPDLLSPLESLTDEHRSGGRRHCRRMNLEPATKVSRISIEIDKEGFTRMQFHLLQGSSPLMRPRISYLQFGAWIGQLHLAHARSLWIFSSGTCSCTQSSWNHSPQENDHDEV